MVAAPQFEDSGPPRSEFGRGPLDRTEATRAVAGSLERVLADTVAARIMTDCVQWNALTAGILPFDPLLVEQRNEMIEAGDQIASRIRELGELAPSSIGVFSELSGVEEDADVSTDGDRILERLERAHLVVARAALDEAISEVVLVDDISADLLRRRAHVHRNAASQTRNKLRR